MKRNEEDKCDAEAYISSRLVSGFILSCSTILVLHNTCIVLSLRSCSLIRTIITSEKIE